MFLIFLNCFLQIATSFKDHMRSLIFFKEFLGPAFFESRYFWRRAHLTHWLMMMLLESSSGKPCIPADIPVIDKDFAPIFFADSRILMTVDSIASKDYCCLSLSSFLSQPGPMQWSKYLVLRSPPANVIALASCGMACTSLFFFHSSDECYKLYSLSLFFPLFKL